MRQDADTAADRQLRELLRAHAATYTPPPGLAARIRTAAPRSRSAPGIARRAGRIALLAAAIALTGAGVSYLALGPRVLTVVGVREPVDSYRPRLVAFVQREHSRCCIDEAAAARKLTIRNLDEAPPAFVKRLSAAPDLTALGESGLRFRGGGPCAVPGPGGSIHLLFDLLAEGGSPEASVSVFCQTDTGALPLESGKVHRLSSPAPEPGAPAEVYAWRRDGLIYFVVSESHQAAAIALAAIGAERNT